MVINNRKTNYGNLCNIKTNYRHTSIICKERNGRERSRAHQRIVGEIVKSLNEYEKKTFFENVEKELPNSNITLDDFDDDDIIYYLENRGYRVIE